MQRCRTCVVATEDRTLDQVRDAAIVLEIAEGAGPKNLGYNQFATQIGFDPDGKLLWMGAWE